MGSGLKMGACMGLLLMPLQALAQQAAPAASGAPMVGPPRGDHLTLGLGTLYSAGYDGSNRYRARVLPVIDYAKGRFFVNMRQGIGFLLAETGGRKASASLAAGLTYLPGYRRSDVPTGVGPLRAGMGLRITANGRVGPLIGSLGVTKPVLGGSEGVLADASIGMPWRIAPKLGAMTSLRLGWADGDYNRAYHGIDAVRAAASGLPQFRPGGGLREVGAQVALNYRMTDRISLTASGGVSTLLGDIRRSPLVKDVTQPVGIVSLSYRFGQ
jgi:outer membrane protein